MDEYSDNPDPHHSSEEQKMGLENVSDKVNINLGDGGYGRSGDGGAGIAAIIAALGNRNQGNDNAALIAALGNRNDDSNSWAGPMMAMLANRRDGDGFGAQGLWPILLLALLGRRGFGDGDGNHGGHHGCDGRDGISPGMAALLQTLTEGQASLRAEGPENTLRAQGEILQAIGSLALGTQQGFANTGDKIQSSLLAELAAISGVKDSVMNNAALISRDLAAVNQNVSSQGCQTREVVAAESQKTRDLINDLNTGNLQRELAVAQNALAEERHRGHTRDVEFKVEQSVAVNQAQAQAQEQRQRQSDNDDLRALIRDLSFQIVNVGNQVQRVKADQDIVNFGTMAASGNQATTSTAVR